jgi:hypothetical protein
MKESIIKLRKDNTEDNTERKKNILRTKLKNKSRNTYTEESIIN